MWETINQLVTSKKFIATVGAVVAIICTKVAGKFDIVIDSTTANHIAETICFLVAVYVGAQGIADHGKEAAKIKLAADAAALKAPKNQ